MIEPRGYNSLLKVSADNKAINILVLLCLLQELFTFSKCITNTFSTLPHSKSFVYRAQSSIKLIWYGVPPAIALCLTMAAPHCKKVLFILLFRDRKAEVDWRFMIHFLEEIPVWELWWMGSAEPAAVMPCRGSSEQWHLCALCHADTQVSLAG